MQLRNITGARGVFVLAGPRARDVMAKLTDVPLDNASFPWLTGQVIEAGFATDVYALRVNFVGALGWELHFPIEYAHHLFDAIFAAGAEYGIGMVGMRAMESLRMEKSYRMWGSDLTRDYTPFEAGLTRFVRMEKAAFIGREALEKQLEAGVPHSFVTLEVHDVTDADPLGNEPLFDGDGKHRRPRHLRLLRTRARARASPSATSNPRLPPSAPSSRIEILGERKRATVLVDSPYDPQNEELRA